MGGGEGQGIIFDVSSLLESQTSEIHVQMEFKNDKLSLNSFNIDTGR